LRARMGFESVVYSPFLRAAKGRYFPFAKLSTIDRYLRILAIASQSLSPLPVGYQAFDLNRGIL
jgi:hypothetical protein